MAAAAAAAKMAAKRPDGGGGTGGGCRLAPRKTLVDRGVHRRPVLPTFVTAATATTKSGRSSNGSYWKDAILAVPRYCSRYARTWDIRSSRSAPRCRPCGNKPAPAAAAVAVARAPNPWRGSMTSTTKQRRCGSRRGWPSTRRATPRTGRFRPAAARPASRSLYDHAQDEGENVNVACDWSKGSGGGGIPGSKVSRAYNDTAPLLFSRLKAGWRAV